MCRADCHCERVRQRLEHQSKVKFEQATSDAIIWLGLEMYQLLKGGTSNQPLSQSSSVRSFIQVCSICCWLAKPLQSPSSFSLQMQVKPVVHVAASVCSACASIACSSVMRSNLQPVPRVLPSSLICSSMRTAQAAACIAENLWKCCQTMHLGFNARLGRRSESDHVGSGHNLDVT